MARAKKTLPPVVFDMSTLTNPKDAPEPIGLQKRFYWHWHRDTGKLAVRFGPDLYLVDEVNTTNMSTWTATHGIPPLKKLAAGNATRIYIKAYMDADGIVKDRAVLS